MKLLSLKSWQFNLLLFLAIATAVLFLEFTLLNRALEVGFTPDDWELYTRYKALGSAPLAKIGQVWTDRGIYTTYQIYYLGLLDFFVGYNHRLFQTINIIFKIIATMSLYPLILIVFRRRLLAVLATFMFAISHASVGPLEFALKGSDYVAIFWMNIFLIAYYFSLKKGLKFIWTIMALIPLILSMVFSPIRIFPIFAILPLIEIYLLIKKTNLDQLKKSLVRLLIFYLPFIWVILRYPNTIIGIAPLGIYHKITQGNWYLLLSPISGLGDTFITNQYWGRIFGPINIHSLNEYFHFLLERPTIIFAFLTALLAFLKSKNPLRFFLTIFLLNILLEVIIFFIIFQQVNFDPNTLYPILFGAYILVLSIVFFINWFNGSQKDSQLLALWLGLLLLIIFTVGTWAFAPLGTGFSSTSYFLVVASLGTSLSLAALLDSLYDRILHFNNRVFRYLTIPLLALVITSILLMSGKTIDERFANINANGGSAVAQKMMQEKVRKTVRNFDSLKPALFYFDTSEIGGDSTFYLNTLLYTLPSWLHFRDGQVTNGCIESLYDSKEKLVKLIQIRDGEKGFVYRGLCVDKGDRGVYYKQIFYKPENFYAFKLKDRELINIKEKVLSELGF